MSHQALAYLPPKDGLYPSPLDRFLPPFPKAVISTWLKEHTKQGDLIIDPLGSNPMLALEVASANRKVMFARNNPVLWLILEVLASSPTEKEISAAVSKLLLSRQGGVTLEEQLKAIYISRCFDCGESIQPDGYIWNEGAVTPILKVYQCPACGAQGEKPVNDEDIQSLRNLGNIGLQRTRAFQRAASDDEYECQTIDHALDCYLPRSIFTLMLLVNRLDRLDVKKEEKLLLQAVLLSIFDDGNSLWYWPLRDHRPLQLNVPSRYFERNLFLSLESGHEKWQSPFGKIDVCYYPQMPNTEGGICLYQRRLADQENFLADLMPQACTTVFPRPNQAFWTLSALWSGWLWGRNGSIPMRSALARRRYDWYWFAQAISSTMIPVARKIGDESTVFGLFPEATANFYLGLSCGMNTAGFHLDGYAYRPSRDMIQNHWQTGSKSTDIELPDIRKLIKDLLIERGEPASFNEFLMSVISEFFIQGAIAKEISQIDEGLLKQIQENITLQLRDEHFTLAYATNQPGGSKWWLVDAREAKSPLAERVELFIKNFLETHPNVNLHDVERVTCQEFRGRLTPSPELIHSVIVSYSLFLEPSRVEIKLRGQEEESQRISDLREACILLKKTGKTLGFDVKGPELGVIEWRNEKRSIISRFFLKSSCDIMDQLINTPEEEAILNIFVLPGSRSRLIAYRMREDPRFTSALSNNWHFLKFRHLRRLAAMDNLTFDLWKDLLDGDPLLWEAPEQTPLL
ncbi:MAG: hypothetical protein FJZ98_05885 [Chloroflexi bacterium]|nr:hypothetical protein [Chloroflexota bacterium]